MKLKHVLLSGAMLTLFSCSDSPFSPRTNSSTPLEMSSTAKDPISYVTYEVSLPTGKIAKITEQLGEMTTITFNELRFGISPWMEGDEVVLKVSQGKGDSADNETSELLEELAITPGDPAVVTKTEPMFSVQLIEVSEEGPPVSTIAGGQGQCCISCVFGNWTVTACGCAVVMECGWCCVSGCCGF